MLTNHRIIGTECITLERQSKLFFQNLQKIKFSSWEKKIFTMEIQTILNMNRFYFNLVQDQNAGTTETFGFNAFERFKMTILRAFF